MQQWPAKDRSGRLARMRGCITEARPNPYLQASLSILARCSDRVRLLSAALAAVVTMYRWVGLLCIGAIPAGKCASPVLLMGHRSVCEVERV
eukprot:1157877-Pelagomonas_calceolata.AAC.3